MAGIQATAGVTLSIGGLMVQKSTDFASSDFASQSWIPCAWLENLGQLGDQATSITFSPIAEQRTRKLKGTRDAGEMALVMAVDHTDPGQIALLAAERQPDDYAFKIEFNDKISSHGAERFFIAKVMSVREQLDTVNNVIKLNVTLGVNSNVVKVDPA